LPINIAAFQAYTIPERCTVRQAIPLGVVFSLLDEVKTEVSLMPKKFKIAVSSRDAKQGNMVKI
jgi:hypothetical protein